MVRTIIHRARMGGRCPNGVQHTSSGIKFPSYCGEGGGIFLVRTLCVFQYTSSSFFKHSNSQSCMIILYSVFFSFFRATGNNHLLTEYFPVRRSARRTTTDLKVKNAV